MLPLANETPSVAENSIHCQNCYCDSCYLSLVYLQPLPPHSYGVACNKEWESWHTDVLRIRHALVFMNCDNNVILTYYHPFSNLFSVSVLLPDISQYVTPWNFV